MPEEQLQANDYLVLLGHEDRVVHRRDWGVTIGRPDDKRNGQNYFVDLAEVIIPPRSGVLGKSLAELNFRNKYHLTGVALWREGLSFRNDVGTIALEPGDALLMVGAPDHIKNLTRERDFLVLQSTHTARPPRPHKAQWAIAITVLVLLASILELIPTAEAMMIGVAAMALTGCINLDDAYRSSGRYCLFGGFPDAHCPPGECLDDGARQLYGARLSPCGQWHHGRHLYHAAHRDAAVLGNLMVDGNRSLAENLIIVAEWFGLGIRETTNKMSNQRS